MNVLGGTIIDALLWIIRIYWWVLLVRVILDWLLHFNIVNRHQTFVRLIGDAVYSLTEPVLYRIRKFIPPMGGLDLSVLALLFAMFVLERFLLRLAVEMYMSGGGGAAPM
jgi:YggT family protein